MSALTQNRIALVAATTILVGCAKNAGVDSPSSDVRPAGAHLSQAQVITIAKNAAEREGIGLTNFADPKAYFEFTKKDKVWSVFFDGKIPMPGNHFLVWVDDQTQQAKIMGGD
jgi:hypothetical protein